MSNGLSKSAKAHATSSRSSVSGESPVVSTSSHRSFFIIVSSSGWRPPERTIVHVPVRAVVDRDNGAERQVPALCPLATQPALLDRRPAQGRTLDAGCHPRTAAEIEVHGDEFAHVAPREARLHPERAFDRVVVVEYAR